MASPLVLIAEDEAIIAMLYAELLGGEGYRLRMATRIADGIRSARAELPAGLKKAF